MKAISKQLRVSSKKAALMASLIRNKKALDAIDILRFTPKKAAKMLLKTIASAIANAENNFKQDKNTLYIKEVFANEGTTYKRGIHISRGRSHPLLKRTSRLTVKLESRASEPAATKDKVKSSEKSPEPKVKTKHS